MSQIAYICSPYRGSADEIERNTIYARELVALALLNDYVPLCPHLYLTQVLDDRNERDRVIGMQAGLELLLACDVMIVGARYGISEGMRAEIERAQSIGMRILQAVATD